MEDGSYFVAGLQRGNIIMVEQFNSTVPLRIEVVSGRVAGGGVADIIKGELHSPEPPFAALSQLVALKVIICANENPIKKERIRRELAAVEVARHPHILPFIGAGTVSGCTILVSAFMRHGDMMAYIKAHPAARKERLIYQVSDAVNHLHSFLGLVHGDLKCQNVLITDNGDALLADFGLTTTTGESSGEDLTSTAIRMANTLRFAAPELLTDSAKSPSGRIKSKTIQSDVYAFGMLIIQAFTETHPWPVLGDNEFRLKLKSKESHPRPEKSAEMGLTDSWWDLCRTCSKFKPEERPTMGEIYSQLTTIVASRQVDLLTFDQITPSYGHVEDRFGYRDANSWLLDAIRGPRAALEQLPPSKRDWNTVVNAFAQCPLLIQSKSTRKGV